MLTLSGKLCVGCMPICYYILYACTGLAYLFIFNLLNRKAYVCVCRGGVVILGQFERGIEGIL
jgi:hypothetical protein